MANQAEQALDTGTIAWHLYSVILDPDVYPLDTAFIAGRTVRPHAEEEVS